MELILDGKAITNKQELFSSLKAQIDSSEFYGNNLDALWEVLNSIKEAINIEIIHYADLRINLGEYVDSLIQLFVDLKTMNSEFKLTLLDEKDLVESV
jgi:ribonuclease inhibitor